MEFTEKELGVKVMPLWTLERVPRRAAKRVRFRNRPNDFGYVHAVGLPVVLPVGQDISTDGMNEHGLTIAAQILHSSAYAPDGSSKSEKHEVAFINLIPFLLGFCKDVDEVIHMLTHEILVVNALVDVPQFNLHWGVQDAKGKSIVVESIKGNIVISDNSQVRTLTNDPSYDFQITNLNAFSHLLVSKHPEELAHVTNPLDHTKRTPRYSNNGFELLGLPGDYSPQSRFVRMFVLKQLVQKNSPVTTIRGAVEAVLEIMSSVAIPRGVIGDKGSYAMTHFSVLKIPSKKLYLFKTYTNSRWKEIDVGAMDFSEETGTLARIKMSEKRDDGIQRGDVFAAEREIGEPRVVVSR